MLKFKSIAIVIAVFFSLFAASCSRPVSIGQISGRVLPVDSISAPLPDPLIDSILTGFRIAMGQEMNQVLALSAFPIMRASPEGLLNNFVADLVFETAQTLYKPEDGVMPDFCVLNYGGLRANLPKGNITMGNVYELMPFENEIVIVTLTGQKTWELLQFLAASQRGMPVSGLTLKIQNQQVAEARVQGELFDMSRNYKIVTSDFLAKGGDRMTFFLDPLEITMVGKRVREAIINHMKAANQRGEVLAPVLDGRMNIIE